MNCIQVGMIKSGHQQPPNGASMREVNTPIELALRSVFTRVASITPKADDMIMTSMERRITAPGSSPKSILNIKRPTIQNIAIWISPLPAVPRNVPAMMDSRLTELASILSSVLFYRYKNYTLKQ